MPPCAQAAASIAPSSSTPLSPSAAGPSLRQDNPRPPLRYVALRARRNGVLAWHHGLARWHAARRDVQRDLRRHLLLGRDLVSRAHASAARNVGQAIARLDARVLKPALWPFRPAQREMLARSLAALSMAFVALAWIAAYSTLTPTQAARPPAPPPPKPFTGRVVSPALLPAAAAPAPEFAF